jgi:cytochrome oxidase Cu insertion factor (SCO1/SenC/PrrC family)
MRGASFQPTEGKRRPVTDADYRRRRILVLFGYTNCAEECLLTLQEMATTLTDLGLLADRIAVLFVTIDPVHYTPERLAGYIENFSAAGY